MILKKCFKKCCLKKITFLIIICTVMLTCSIIFGFKDRNKGALLVNSTPITNRTIILDAGHGLPDEGAIGFSGTTEETINLAITLKLQKTLEQSGANVILTRSDENGIYDISKTNIRNKKVSDIKNRTYIGNNSEADIYVSIHLNKYQDSKYDGWQTFYQYQSEKSKKVAECIQNELNKNISEENTRVPMSLKGVYIMDNINIPTVVIECGFLSNPVEEKSLKDSSYQNKLVWGIYIGLHQYFFDN